jgi:hypothetical protein
LRTSRTVMVNERARSPTAPMMRPRTTTVLRRGRRRLGGDSAGCSSGSVGAVPCRVPLRIFLLRSAEAPRTGTSWYPGVAIRRPVDPWHSSRYPVSTHRRRVLTLKEGKRYGQEGLQPEAPGRPDRGQAR